jgi:hypothetical protein
MPRCGEVALDTGSAPPLLHLRIKTTKQERGRQPVVFNRCATLGCAPYCFANPFREPCAYRFANALARLVSGPLTDRFTRVLANRTCSQTLFGRRVRNFSSDPLTDLA